jgi:hypothetical protein
MTNRKVGCFCCLRSQYVPHNDWLPSDCHSSYSSLSMLLCLWIQLVHFGYIMIE